MEEKLLTFGFIGDLHGKRNWAKFIEDDSVDHWVFVGDLVDNDFGSVIADEEMVENLSNIIDFKRKNMNKVTLLIGNHDVSYLYINNHSVRASRFRESIAMELHDLYAFNKDCFQNSWQYKNVIATHAGIQHNWFVEKFKGDLNENIANQLNNPKDDNQNTRLFDVGRCRGGWTDVGGIYWADRSELVKPLKGFIQVAGHNRVKDITNYQKGGGEINFIDCLGTVNKFLKLEI